MAALALRAVEDPAARVVWRGIDMKRLLPSTMAALWLALSGAVAGGPPPGAGRYIGPPGGIYRPGYPALRPFYPGWRGAYPGWGVGYWGPGAGLYWRGGPGYWAGWPYYGYGYGWGAGFAYPYTYAYPPLVLNTSPAPQVFIQQEAPAPAAAAALPATSYWYYCTQPAGYFPYVQGCSHAWMKVVPQAPSDPPGAPRLAP
jgi:hypothetical protein